MNHLITGATGDVGSRVVRNLLQRGFRPRILARDEEKARLMFSNDVDVIIGDLADRASLRKALYGADTLYLVNVGPHIPERDEAAAYVSKELGVKKIVKLSSLDVEHGLAIGAWHELGEARYGPQLSHSSLYALPVSCRTCSHGRIALRRNKWSDRPSAANGRRPFIHSEDIAAVSIEALIKDTYLGQALPITGPESLTFEEATAIIAKAVGRPLRFEAISDEEARERYAKVSGSPEETEAHVALWRAIRQGRLAAVTHDVEQVLGRHPITLRQWVEENAASFCSQ